MNQINEPLERLLNQKQVSEILGMSEAWLEMCRFKKREIPFIKIGRAVRYRHSDVIAYCQNNAQKVSNA